MLKKDIEERFRDMLLIHNNAHNMWHFPIGVNSEFQFAISNLGNLGMDNNRKPLCNIRVIGVPVSLQGWYNPEEGILRIQIIIQELFENIKI